MVRIKPTNLVESADLCIVHAGMEQCAPSHAFGPAVREYFLFHFILTGRGCFHAEGQVHSLQNGSGFLIFPDQVTFYVADRQAPWHYVWVAFRGTRAGEHVHQAGFSLQTPILQTAFSDQAPVAFTIDGIFRQISHSLNLQQGREPSLFGLLRLFLAQLIAANPRLPQDENQFLRRDWYVQQALDHLEMNYASRITIAGLAAYIGLDRSYFGQLFREATGLSPQQHLLHLRMSKACQLMRHSRLPVGVIARSVGYDDPLLFSRMFHRVIGCAPSEYPGITGS